MTVNQLQFSIQQFFVLLSVTVVSTVAIFSLGLMAASLMSESPESTPMAAVEAPQAIIAETAPTVVQTPPLDTSIIPLRQPPQTLAEPVRYGVQVAVFEQLENAITYADKRHDADFQARIFSKTSPGAKTVYPVLVGLYDNMDDAQQAKHAFHERFAADSFVTDATQLQEAVVLIPTVAMLR